ncbi:MAG TPA: ABC transporter ATP-binding protein [Trinickia sp.]|nr:ABC transporter ATP-binding protein [Trinickia sp.]
MKPSFLLFIDYIKAYQININRYRAFPIHVIATTVFVAIVAGLEALIPYLLRETTNTLVLNDRSVSTYAILIAGAYGFGWTLVRVLEWVKSMMSAAMLARCDASFQKAFSAHLMQVEYSRLVNVDIGSMLATLCRARNAFSSITFAFFWIIVPTIIQLVFSTVVLWTVTDAAFGIGFAVSILLLFGVTWRLAEQSKNAHADIFDADNQISSHAVERLTFALDIKLNRAYARERSVLDKVLNRYVRRVSRGNARLAILLAAQALFAGLLLTVFTVLAALKVTSTSLTVGDFVMIVGYIVALTTPFTFLAASLSELKRNHLALQEGFDILRLPLESGAADGPFNRSEQVVLSIENAGVAVGEQTILCGVNFQAERNQLTALVGPSGSGKSSLAHLMLGLIRPSTGKVSLLGADISGIAVPAIMKEVAAVSQIPLILSGSLRDNLVFGCEQAPADSFLMEIVAELELTELNRGDGGNVLNQQLGIQGRDLSGGERQRIALGRALARRPAILILDEPTSSLDPARETRILERIRRRVPTIIAITHRDALSQAADRIYEVRDGCVREMNPVDISTSL